MKPEVVLEFLEAAAEKLKVRVSYEPLQTSVVHGGLCRVKGDYRIIIDKRASAEERVTTLATAIAQVMKQNGITPDDAALELSPKVQEVLRVHEPGPGRGVGVGGGRTAA
ncbi:MAG TPA: hypothetical protein VHT91_34730 [Kofleriaceae bacterium]|jgi:hypothetical protein|nr:hypothetical protein [Kofleriaceae bacterium]